MTFGHNLLSCCKSLRNKNINISLLNKIHNLSFDSDINNVLTLCDLDFLIYWTWNVCVSKKRKTLDEYAWKFELRLILWTFKTIDFKFFLLMFNYYVQLPIVYKSIYVCSFLAIKSEDKTTDPQTDIQTNTDKLTNRPR